MHIVSREINQVLWTNRRTVWSHPACPPCLHRHLAAFQPGDLRCAHRGHTRMGRHSFLFGL